MLVGVLSRAKAAFDVDLASLCEVVAGDFRKLVEADDAMPLGVVAVGSVRLLDASGRGKGELRDDVAAAGGVHLGITAEVADEDDFVDHGWA